MENKHKVFQNLGKRTLLIEGANIRDGLFLVENGLRKFIGKCAVTGAHDGELEKRVKNYRDCLCFVEPHYEPLDQFREEIATGYDCRERINLENPILEILIGIDHKKLNVRRITSTPTFFVGGQYYSSAVYVNDGHAEYYKFYRPLKNSGFRITRPRERFIEPWKRLFPLAYHIEHVLIDENINYGTLILHKSDCVRIAVGYSIIPSQLGKKWVFPLDTRELAKKINERLKKATEEEIRLRDRKHESLTTDAILYIAAAPEQFQSKPEFVDVVKIEFGHDVKPSLTPDWGTSY